MIQRVQSIYLLLVAVVSFLGVPWLPLSEEVSAWEILIICMLNLTGALALFSLFSFKNRKKQFVINRLNIVCNLVLLGVLAWLSLSTSGGNSFPEKGVQALLPVISIILLFLANRAIKRDEDLVKSADRLR